MKINKREHDNIDHMIELLQQMKINNNGFSCCDNEKKLTLENSHLMRANEQRAIDWNKVPVNTEVLVSNGKFEEKNIRKFVAYLPRKSYYICFNDGHGQKDAPGITEWDNIILHPNTPVEEEWYK